MARSSCPGIMSEHAGIRDGHNVVIHEFVHKLDMQNGAADGFPPMHTDINSKNWSKVFTYAFEDFQHNPKPGLDRYAATAPAEFLAVLSEVFSKNRVYSRDTYPQSVRIAQSVFQARPHKTA